MGWTTHPHVLKSLASIAFLFGCFGFLARAVNIGTSVVTTEAVVTLTQDDYRWYENIDALNPATFLASENSATPTPSLGTVVRLRMSVENGNAQLNAGAVFRLQYANTTAGPWTDLSTSTAWIFFDNAGVADGQIIVTTLLASSDVGESYGESNPSAASPGALLPGKFGEWDWVIRNNSADTASSWLFRMASSSGAAFDGYNNYPTFSAVSTSPPSPPLSGGPPQGGGGGTGYVAPPGTPVALPPRPTSSLPVPPPVIPPRFQLVDFNGDGRVDMIDLSILLYYYGERGDIVRRYDLNRSGIVGLADVSILMYYWVE
ncbi:MAG: hypothetical protein A2945_03310 [Candidatus Liptonbacteria bacterium RIFCSPLOWO2_01_FULL_52_25]|uniref:Dockerin domain-containing protein n=1 Tax=Candidatus Liptonbacteria bacterium RIFCSPLOWO2_01_FULL_52_25 TaxID=1798650 RepID=A0A1G2CGW0_9BACT|nr:MAG: hypothetical protein A2945_03310 [Candidatus Liptonbacteria bacterium RIFCSPLOWO2_01_FULL_52_25]